MFLFYSQGPCLLKHCQIQLYETIEQYLDSGIYFFSKKHPLSVNIILLTDVTPKNLIFKNCKNYRMSEQCKLLMFIAPKSVNFRYILQGKYRQ